MMRVPMVETVDGFGPDLPDGFVGTATLTEQGDYLLSWDGVDPRADSLTVVARMTVVDRLDTLSDDTVAEVAALFDPWQVGEDVVVGDVRRWDGTLVECLQAHTTQADWTPDVTPALWKIHRTDDGTAPIEWQPGLALTVDDQVLYDGVLYDVVQAHTTQAGWEPPSVPALFAPAG